MVDRPTVDGPLTAEELEDRDAQFTPNFDRCLECNKVHAKDYDCRGGWDRQFKLDTLPAPWPEVYTHSGCGNQYTGGQDF